MGEWFDNMSEWYDSDGPDPDDNDPYGVHRGIIPPRSSNITQLDLASANAGNGIREWIQACEALQSCRIIHNDVVSPYHDYQPRRIYGSLSLHKLTLESLWIEIIDDTGNETDNDWMGSFVDFPAVKVLCAPLPNLVGLDENEGPMRKFREILPCSLETLYIMSREREGYREALMDFLTPETLKDYPKLAAIHLESLEFRVKPELMDKLEGLKQRCQEVGILFYSHSLVGWCGGDEKPISWVFGPVNETRLLGRI